MIKLSDRLWVRPEDIERIEVNAYAHFWSVDVSLRADATSRTAVGGFFPHDGSKEMSDAAQIGATKRAMEIAEQVSQFTKSN